MAVSAEVAQEHIRSWVARLRRFPQLANWPGHLFHAADLSNAVEILRSGRLICRRDLSNIICDVANQEALWNNPEAHGYVRLYFRPRTMFHLSTEGIKCLGDQYRRDPHMSVPVIFAFDAQRILTLDGVGYSRGKLSRQRPIGFDDAFFQSIDFERVYHDGPLPRESQKDVQDKRMAEVVVPDELPLLPYLKAIVCRTPLERRTLIHRLSGHAADLLPRITVEQVPHSTFLHKSLYLTGLRFWQGELVLDFHPPMEPPRSGEYRLEVEHRIGREIVQAWRGGVPADWHSARLPGVRDLPGGVWTIRLEEVLAFEGPIPSETSTIR